MIINKQDFSHEARCISMTRHTVQRQIVFEAVKALGSHSSAEQVYMRIAQNHPSISKATVYRNLNQMAQAGLLRNIGVIDGAAHYDHNTHAHYHFICDGCKKIFDVESDAFRIPIHLISTKEFSITDCRLTFTGMCRECKNSGTS